jgi:hypothetical protein
MQLNLTSEEIKTVLQSLKLYATTCRIDAQAAPTPEYAAHLTGYALEAEDLANKLNAKLEPKPKKPKSGKIISGEARPIDPYSEWSPNDPRNW